jgi:hypothetical protein
MHPARERTRKGIGSSSILQPSVGGQEWGLEVIGTARGWSNGLTGEPHSGVFCRVRECFGTTRVIEDFRNDLSHHPGAGVGLPSRATARPSSAEEGSKMSNLRELIMELYADRQ